MRQDRTARALAAALAMTLAAAIALTVAVALDDDPLPGELRLLREMQQWSFLGGTFADIVRFVTTTQVVTITGAAVAVGLWVAGERRAAVALALAIVALNVVQPSIKQLVDRARPTEDLVEIRASITSPSFPAGHVMSPTVLYGFLIGLAALRTAWPVQVRVLVITASLVLLAATGMVNLYLGVHWPADVLGGWLWGALLALSALLMRSGLLECPHDRSPRA